MVACLVLAVLVFTGISCQQANSSKGRAKILISPGPFSFTLMEARFLFIIDHLTKETGWKFDMVAAPQDYEAFLKMTNEEKFAFGFVNPYLYLLLAETRGAVPLVKAVFADQQSGYRGLIVANERSKIESLRDLRGKEIMAPSRINVGGFILQWLLLKDQGLDPDRDVTYKFGQTQEDILEAIISGRAEVGFTREDVLLAMSKAKGGMPKIRVVASTPFCPTPCFVTFPGTDPALAEEVKKILLDMNLDDPKERFMLERLRVIGFAPASPEEYREFQDKLVANNLFPLHEGGSSTPE